MTAITFSFRIWAWKFRRLRNFVLSVLMSVTSQISDFVPPPSWRVLVRTKTCAEPCAHIREPMTLRLSVHGKGTMYLGAYTYVHVQHTCVQREPIVSFSELIRTNHRN